MNTPVDAEILIKVLTSFESGGMDAAIATINQLGQAADKSSKDGDKLAALMDLVKNKAGDAKNIFTGLCQVLKGGTGTVAGFGRAASGLATAFGAAAGPVGLVVTAVQLGVTALIAWQQHQDAAAEAAEKAAEREKDAAEKAKQAIEDLDKARADAARAAIADLKEELDGATNAARATRTALDALEDSELAVKIAGIDAQEKSGKIDSDTADYLKNRARVDSANRKDKRALDDLSEEETRLTTARNKSAQAAFDAATECEKADKAFNDAEAALAQASAELAAFEARGPISLYDADAAERIFEHKQLEEAKATAEKHRDAAKAEAESAGTELHAANAKAKAAADELAAARIDTRRQTLQNNIDARNTTIKATEDARIAESKRQADIDKHEAELEPIRTALKKADEHAAADIQAEKNTLARHAADRALQIKQLDRQLIGVTDPLQELEIKRKKEEIKDAGDREQAEYRVGEIQREISRLGEDATNAQRENLESQLATAQTQLEAQKQDAANHAAQYNYARQQLQAAQNAAAPEAPVEEKPLKDLSPSERLARNKAKRQDKRAPASETTPASSAPAQSTQTAEAAITAASAANETAVTDLSATLDRLPEAVPDLSGLSASITAADTAAQSAASSNAQTLSSLSSSLQSLSTLVVNLSSLTSKIQTLTSNINSAATRISNAFQTATGVIEHLTNVFPDFDNLINAVKKLDKRVDKLEHDLSRID